MKNKIVLDLSTPWTSTPATAGNVPNSGAAPDPLMAPIKDAGDESRRGCQSSKGPPGEQKAGGGVTQP